MLAVDVVVMDEAHRLRKVYKTSNVIANTPKQGLSSAPKSSPIGLKRERSLSSNCFFVDGRQSRNGAKGWPAVKF